MSEFVEVSFRASDPKQNKSSGTAAAKFGSNGSFCSFQTAQEQTSSDRSHSAARELLYQYFAVFQTANLLICALIGESFDWPSDSGRRYLSFQLLFWLK